MLGRRNLKTEGHSGYGIAIALLSFRQDLERETAGRAKRCENGKLDKKKHLSEFIVTDKKSTEKLLKRSVQWRLGKLTLCTWTREKISLGKASICEYLQFA